MFTDNIANDGSGENEEIYDSSDELQSWDDLNNIDPSILRGIYSYGFERPSPIQKKAIKPIMSGRDIIAQAQSGTGKTAAFQLVLYLLLIYKIILHKF